MEYDKENQSIYGEQRKEDNSMVAVIIVLIIWCLMIMMCDYYD
jgi:hypothetical protein